MGTPATKIYFQTMLPTNDSFGKLTNHYNKESRIQAINDGLKTLARQENIEVIDLYPHFADVAGKLKKEYTWDGVHLTLAGYQCWVQVLENGNYIKRRR